MLTFADPDLARRAKHLTTQAKLPGYAYLHDEVGYNYRLPNVGAALGVAQLERLGAFLQIKREIAATYRKAFSGLPLDPPPAPGGMAPSYWLYSVLLPEPWERPLKALEAQGIQTRPLWTALHLMPPYRDCQLLGSGEVAEDLCRRGLSLPCSTTLRPEDQARVVAALREMFGA